MLPTHLCRIVAFSQVMSSLVQLMSTYYYSFNYVIKITIGQYKGLHLRAYQHFLTEALSLYPSSSSAPFLSSYRGRLNGKGL